MKSGAPKSKLSIALIGASGRLGQAINRMIALEFGDRAETIVEVGREHLKLSALDFAKAISGCHLCLDVSLPGPCTAYMEKLLEAKKRKALKSLPLFVVGSTGWTSNEMTVLKKYSASRPVLLAPNFSPVVNLFVGLLEQYAPLFKEWGYDVSVTEVHHSQKRDAPSGTAKALIAPLEDAGHKPQVSSVRAGKIVGTHKVSFIGQQDIFELQHEALDRDLFARGAILAALWLGEMPLKSTGIFSMKDVIRRRYQKTSFLIDPSNRSFGHSSVIRDIS